MKSSHIRSSARNDSMKTIPPSSSTGPVEPQKVAAKNPSAQELVEHFPLPGLILGKDSAVYFENERCRHRIAGHWLADAADGLRTLAGNEQTRVMEVVDPQGQRRLVTAYATPLGDQTVVVFDDRTAGGRAAEAAELQRRIAELEKLSATDRLTGLWNRHHFDEVVARELAFSEREHSPVSLLLFDLDHFKSVNDKHGHATGDDVLRVTAKRLQEASRPTDLLFRWGGEEFALLAPATSVQAAAAVAGRLRACIAAQPFPVAGHLTISAGVAEHQAGELAAGWFERVDTALYQAKAAGRNRVSVAPGGASETWIAQEQASALRLIWSDRFVCGHRLIDDEHRSLFDATNALVAMMTDVSLKSNTVLVRIDALLAAVARHFADEEKVLAEIHYPQLQQHRRLHQKLLDSSRHLRDALHAGKSSPGEVVEFLAYEVINRHILRADRRFFPFLAGDAHTAS